MGSELSRGRHHRSASSKSSIKSGQSLTNSGTANSNSGTDLMVWATRTTAGAAVAAHGYDFPRSPTWWRDFALKANLGDSSPKSGDPPATALAMDKESCWLPLDIL